VGVNSERKRVLKGKDKNEKLRRNRVAETQRNAVAKKQDDSREKYYERYPERRPE